MLEATDLARDLDRDLPASRDGPQRVPFDLHDHVVLRHILGTLS
jgi:hypothetical protein